ncbi:MAG TPA: hypothetical protein VLK58_26615 [Conexibacter sp.]|nr:hypothetical protein [Conexibacter sp.]
MDRPTPLTLTLTVQLHLDEDAFTGRALDDLGADREFSGWLGLIAALDELIDTAPARSRDNDAASEERGVETSC